jgi:Mn-dependent DtxR family transcriptional regulator
VTLIEETPSSTGTAADRLPPRGATIGETVTGFDDGALVLYEPCVGVELTDSGETVARRPLQCRCSVGAFVEPTADDARGDGRF